MTFRHISRDLKLRALWMLENGYLPEDIQTILGVSDRSLRRWTANMRAHGDVIPEQMALRGRPLSLTTAQLHSIVDFIRAYPEMYLDELRDFLALESDILVPITTLHRVLANAGLTYKLLRRQALERDNVGRYLWMQETQNLYRANHIIWIDESSKDDRTIYRHYGRAPSGEQPTISAKFVRGNRYSILPALTIDGYIAVRIVRDSVDGAEFFDFIVQDVVSVYLHIYLIYMLVFISCPK